MDRRSPSKTPPRREAGIPKPSGTSRSRLRNLRMTLEYDGTRYRGWQIQRQQRTVAGVLTQAIGDVTRDRVTLIGSGYTEIGVHANGEVVNFRTRSGMPVDHLVDAVNRLLPPDINILRVEDVPLDFHSRYGARVRHYRYQIALRRSAFLKPFSWWPGRRMDTEMIRIGVSYLVGRHDFKPFSDPHVRKDEPMVQVHRASLSEEEPLLHFRIAADHLPPKMLRRMVAILVQVGGREMAPEKIRDMLNGDAAPPANAMAPPGGLFLEKIEFS